MRTADYVTEKTLARKSAGWLEEVRGSVPERPHLRLDPNRCALLVIDMVRYFADPDGRCFLPAAAAVTPRIASILKAWHGLGGTVVFTRHAHEGAHDLGMLGKFFSDHIRAGEPESEIVPALVPDEDDLVFRKTSYDAFTGTPLADHLEEEGIEQVLVTGVLTHMCCETTARAAFCRGFEVYVAADATASSCEERHLHSLLAMADSVAVVMGSDEIVKRCDASR